jgi:hypothetical protein
LFFLSPLELVLLHISKVVPVFVGLNFQLIVDVQLDFVVKMIVGLVIKQYFVVFVVLAYLVEMSGVDFVFLVVTLFLLMVIPVTFAVFVVLVCLVEVFTVDFVFLVVTLFLLMVIPVTF